MGSIRIVLADDHAVVREGLRVLLESEPDFSVVGEAADGASAIELVQRLKPDVLVLDLVMPGLGGTEVTQRIGRLVPKTQVVILSMYASEGYVHHALEAGARAYVVKDAGARQLAEAVRQVSAGERYLSPPLSDRIMEEYASKMRGTELDPYETLTRREREVLHLAATGLTSALIGERLSISRRTVEVHRASVMQKLGFGSPAEMVRYAVERGLLPASAPVPPDEDPGE